MKTSRANITLLVNRMLAEGLIVEGAPAEAFRGRKPTQLFINTARRYIIAVDIRLWCTYIMLTDLVGNQIAPISHYETHTNFTQTVSDLTVHIKRIVAEQGENRICEGIGVVVPARLNSKTGRILVAPKLKWHDVDLQKPLVSALRLPVYIEHGGRACALGQRWSPQAKQLPQDNFIFVSISDGVGVGVVVNGEVICGHNYLCGEFGHIPLDFNGPPCACGAKGCWETYVCNQATLSRYFRRDVAKPTSRALWDFRIEDLIERARGGDVQARKALYSTARYLGPGLATIVKAIDPECIYIGGEITQAWDLIESRVKASLEAHLQIKGARERKIQLIPSVAHPRLRGAAALVAAPFFALPTVG
jgi:N-acetylglucosamine repressor